MKHKLPRLALLLLSLAIAGAGVFSYADAQTKKKALPQKKQVVVKPKAALKSPVKTHPLKKKPATFKPKRLPVRAEEPTIVIIPNQPLIVPPKSVPGTLTHDGVVAWTNVQRKHNGDLAPLATDALLDDIATRRLKDMFANQYFAHNNPTDGRGAGDIAKDIGYPYILIGENIALGDFGTDEKLVQAWMDSPHHRDNILKTGYTEIGVAVGRGAYKGETTWIAVQIFGRPTTACPAIDNTLKNSIDTAQKKIDESNAELARRKAELDALDPKTREQIDSYNAKVRAYNTLVTETNTLVENVKDMIARYNAQIKAFNTCAQS